MPIRDSVMRLDNLQTEKANIAQDKKKAPASKSTTHKKKMKKKSKVR